MLHPLDHSTDYQEPTANNANNSEDGEDDEIQPDDIKVVFHPGSSIPEQIFHFDNYCQDPDALKAPNQVAETTRPPWHPFRTRCDFELAEVMLDSHMNKRQIETLLKIVGSTRDISPNSEAITIQNFTELSEIWSFARQEHGEPVCAKCT